MKKIAYLILAVCTFFTVNAQQDMAFSMYMFNPTFVNPAAAGYLDRAHLSGIFRYQWVGIDGAPRCGNLSFHSPLKNKNMALGATMKYDKLGLFNNIGLDVNYAYRIPLNEKTRLSLGLMGSIFNINDSRQSGNYQTPNDPNAQPVSTFIPNFGAGVFLFSKKYFVGAAVPHLLNLRMNPNNAPGNPSDDLFAKIYNHYFMSAGYVFGKDYGVKFKPTAFFKMSQHTTPNIDLNANLLLQERFWVGLGFRSGGDILDEGGEYRQWSGFRGESLIATFKMLVNQNFEVGYSYDYPFSRLKQATSGSHEIYLGMFFGSKVSERFISPRYVNYF